MVDDPSILRFLSAEPDPGRACQVLIDAATAGGGTDNISVIVIRVDAT
jgi:serine/threonine protein phosphatase PrpC